MLLLHADSQGFKLPVRMAEREARLSARHVRSLQNFKGAAWYEGLARTGWVAGYSALVTELSHSTLATDLPHSALAMTYPTVL